ncbi:helix-turn-helix domain-containing protein [Arthrobacter sp. MDT2-16]
MAFLVSRENRRRDCVVRFRFHPLKALIKASVRVAAFGGWDAGCMTDQPQNDGQSRPLRFLTLQQVADELNTKHSTVRALIASGELPAIQIGGRGQWRIERAMIEDYVTAAYARARTDIARGGVDGGLDADSASDAPE